MSRAREIVFNRPYLYPLQKAAIYSPARYSLIEASTKSGKTVGCLIWIIEQTYGLRPGQSAWWVAPVYAQALIAYRRAKKFLPHTSYRSNDTEMRIDLLPYGGSIFFRSGQNPDNLYGEDVYAAVVDEASRLNEQSWFAIRSTLTATRGHVRIIGNVKGRRNWFYHMCRKAESGEPDMDFHRITAWQAVEGGILDREEIEGAKRLLPENVFRELYMAEASSDEGNPFGFDHVRSCIRPLSSRPVSAWGGDLAKSVDWSVMIGLDSDGFTAAFERFQSPWRETMQRIKETIGQGRAAIDSTGVGDPIVEELQRTNSRIEGFKFSSASKQMLMEGLAVAIQSEMIYYPPGVIVSELESFEYEYTRTGVRYSAPSGYHDDCVCALALANYKLGGRNKQKAKVIFL